MRIPALVGVGLVLGILACQRPRADAPSFPAQEEQSLYVGQQIPFNKVLTKIAIGSCNRQNEDQSIWQNISDEQPDLWIWLGDNIYGDTEDMELLQQKYSQQKQNSLYQQFIQDTPVIGIWDDHDYGVNDGDKTYPMRAESQALMMDFLDVPKDSPFRDQAGTYQSYLFGNEGKQVKVILLDTRYFRDELEKNNGYQRYKPNLNGDILGEAQWTWLEQELKNSTADINLIGSGIQVIPAEHGFEKWANFPQARKRLLDLIAQIQPKKTILLSGDRHLSEFSQLAITGMEDELYEFTSSGLTHSYDSFSGEPNPYRTGEVVSDRSYGLIVIDWAGAEPDIRLQMKGVGGDLLQELVLNE